MSFPTHSGYGKIERTKIVRKKIKVLKEQGNSQKESVEIALNTTPKRKRLPLA